ncbi:unnamed protein product [Boreogadus saida]
MIKHLRGHGVQITECPVFDALRRPSSVATSSTASTSAASTSGSDPHPSTALSVSELGRGSVEEAVVSPKHLHAPLSPTFAPDAAAAGSAAATTTKPGKKRAVRPTTSGPGKRARKAGNFGPRDPHHHPQQVPDADLRQVLHTLAESVQSLGARMDAVETPGRIPGRVQAHNPPSFIATAPFSFQQPSGSAPSASTGYAPGMCSGTTATAAPAVAPFVYSLATALPVQLQAFAGTRTRNPPAQAAKGRQSKGGAIPPRDFKISPIYPN